MLDRQAPNIEIIANGNNYIDLKSISIAFTSVEEKALRQSFHRLQ